MKTLNKLGLLGVFATACVFNPMKTQALQTTLPEPDANGVVTLTDDVKLASTLVLGENSNIKTIDLAGHTLSRGVKYGYLINSSTDLTIKNGSVVCEKEESVIDGTVQENKSSSCIRNNKSLTVEGVKLDAYWTALKAEEGTVMTVKNSTVTSESGTAGAIMNYGNTRVDNSTIKGSAVPNGASILTMSILYGGKAYDANVTINNSTLDAYWPVILGKYDAASEDSSEKHTNNVSFEGENVIISDNFVRRDTKRDDVALEVNGKITATKEALDYLAEGATLVLNKNITEETIVLTGKKLVIANGVEVTEGMLKMEEGAFIENKSGKDLSVIVLGDEEKTVVVKNDEVFDGKVEEPSKPTDPVDPEEPTDPEKPEDPKDPEKPEDPGVDNPQTFDGVTIYAGLAVISIGGAGLLLKKNLN